MKRSKYSESQIVGILKEADAGMKVKEICRTGALPFMAGSSSVNPIYLECHVIFATV